MWINIATTKRPADTKEFFAEVKRVFPEVTAGVVAEGLGCNNIGFIIEADDDFAEHLATQLTMALMPARWSCCEGDPMLKPGEFYDARQLH